MFLCNVKRFRILIFIIVIIMIIVVVIEVLEDHPIFLILFYFFM